MTAIFTVVMEFATALVLRKFSKSMFNLPKDLPNIRLDSEALPNGKRRTKFLLPAIPRSPLLQVYRPVWMEQIYGGQEARSPHFHDRRLRNNLFYKQRSLNLAHYFQQKRLNRLARTT